MLRDLTFTDVQRIDTADAAAGFVMDEEAFRAFYDRTARGLWLYLVRITGDRHAADDLLQDAFYRFLRASASYEDENHRRRSLYRIATNLARDVHRRNVNRPVSAAGSAEIEQVPGADPAGTHEQRTDVARAMSQLKPREREMLWLAYAEGASHREIADVLGLSPASLKPLLFRARRKLAELLSVDRKSSGAQK